MGYVVVMVAVIPLRDSSGHLDRDRFYLGLAAAVAAGADCTRSSVGAVIVVGNRVVATGFNGAPAGAPSCLAGACPRGRASYEEIAALSSYDNCISLHAESNALLHAGREVRGGTVYITREPCPSCAKLMRGAGIVRWVTPDSDSDLN